jgi:hypothetical protein
MWCKGLVVATQHDNASGFGCFCCWWCHTWKLANAAAPSEAWLLMVVSRCAMTPQFGASGGARALHGGAAGVCSNSAGKSGVLLYRVSVGLHRAP